jgi:AcrR family transcriptional regulator
MVRQLFPSKAMIVIEALRPIVDKLRNQTEADRRLKRPVPDTVTRFVSRLAKICADNREFVGALLAVVAHDTAAAPETAVHIKKALDIPGILDPVLRDGQLDGVISTDLAAYDAAAMIVNCLLLRSFSRRDESVDQHTHIIISVLFHGMQQREG